MSNLGTQSRQIPQRMRDGWVTKSKGLEDGVLIANLPQLFRGPATHQLYLAGE